MNTIIRSGRHGVLLGLLTVVATATAQVSPDALTRLATPTRAAAAPQVAPVNVDAEAEFELEVGSGFDLASGKYGGQVRVDELSIPLILQMRRGSVGYKLIVPYVRVVGPGDVLVLDPGSVICDDRRARGRTGSNSNSGGGSDRSGNSLDDCDSDDLDPTRLAQRVTRTGLGDVQVEVAWTAPELVPGGATLDLVGKIKLGTASASKGLGTGKHSGSLQVDVSQPLGRFSVLGSLGYRVFQQVAGVELKNSAFVTLGGELRFGDDASIKLVVDHRRPVQAGANPARELTLAMERPFGQSWRMEAYVFKGLTDASADFGTGLVVARRF